MSASNWKCTAPPSASFLGVYHAMLHWCPLQSYGKTPLTWIAVSGPASTIPVVFPINLSQLNKGL